jgi:hypothetical protein
MQLVAGNYVRAPSHLAQHNILVRILCGASGEWLLYCRLLLALLTLSMHNEAVALLCLSAELCAVDNTRTARCDGLYLAYSVLWVEQHAV